MAEVLAPWRTCGSSPGTAEDFGGVARLERVRSTRLPSRVVVREQAISTGHPDPGGEGVLRSMQVRRRLAAGLQLVWTPEPEQLQTGHGRALIPMQ